MKDRGKTISIMLVGFAPRQAFNVHLYQQRQGDSRQLADYVTSTEGRTADDGNHRFWFRTDGADAGCYVAKVEVAGKVLDDSETRLSGFCSSQSL